ncbi:MAG TPA: UDP-N-acetylglucosamine--N-acetylmuramyl-(pentapeptide) pyrophosphoryl-undecaprenol N-acetylglucosamine transferase [Chloroflexota bacterium]|nr:UDP-N-acetylglucosamine--N-acetylmuramyl-(pentapeptide) pyrophosphoryl-undecaprenol N-acetylglucosamine transferase [Chloroflexota bacterium]
MERSLLPAAGVPSYLVPMAPPTSPRGVALLALATLRALPLLLWKRPRVAIATGGYACVPGAVASWLTRVPVVLVLPDVVPGRAVRALVPLTHTIAASTDAARHYLPSSKTVVTGYPVREEFLRADRARGRHRFDIPGEATVLFVAGGSLGARSLNAAVARLLPHLLERHHVIHVTGRDRWEEVTELTVDLPEQLRDRYHPFPYLDAGDMADALAASDLALMRSGASTLGELPATGTPAVLVPLPLPGVHQRENAQFLADQGAAVVLANDDLDRLGDLLDLLLTDRGRLSGMGQAMRLLFHPDAAERIADLAREAAG